MFTCDEELNYYIENRTHHINQKNYMKYYIDKNLYDLFSYCWIYPNNWEIEFFTLNPNYYKIWNKLSKNYGNTKLIDCEYDKNYHCYTISIFCFDLIIYLKSMHNYSSPMGEKIWKEKAKNCNWSQDEIDYGYSEYKKQCNKWFEWKYGKHVNLGLDSYKIHKIH